MCVYVYMCTCVCVYVCKRGRDKKKAERDRQTDRVDMHLFVFLRNRMRIFLICHLLSNTYLSFNFLLSVTSSQGLKNTPTASLQRHKTPTPQ